MAPKIKLRPAASLTPEATPETVPEATPEPEPVPEALPPLKMRASRTPPLAPAQVEVPPEPTPDLPAPVAARKPRKRAADAEDPDTDLMAVLEDKGYKVLGKVVESGKVRGLKATTVYGEWVLLLLDKAGWQGLSVQASDVVWTESSTAYTAVPPAAKTGYSAVIDPSTAGVVLEQGGDMCVLLREGLESVPTEKVYTLQGLQGKSILAYPVVRVSDLLADPQLTTTNVHSNTLAIQQYARRLSDAGLANAQKQLQRIVALLSDYQAQEKGVVKRLDATYRQLVSWYDSYQGMDQTPDVQAKAQQVAVNIRVRQDALRRLLRAGQVWSSDRTLALLQEMTTRLEEDTSYLQGVEKGIDKIMTE
jgi:hypothetical protein